MAVFFGIEFWRVLWQGLHADLGVLEQEAQCLRTGVNRGMIADQNEPLGSIAQKMLQEVNHVGTPHPTLDIAFVDVPRQGQSHGRRQHPAVAGHPLDHRSLTAGCPGTPQAVHKRTAEFIEKHHVHATFSRLFLCVASRVSARLGLRPRPAPPRGLRVVADSSPSDPTVGGYN